MTDKLKCFQVKINNHDGILSSIKQNFYKKKPTVGMVCHGNFPSIFLHCEILKKNIASFFFRDLILCKKASIPPFDNAVHKG